jgi:hypothetical protein
MGEMTDTHPLLAAIVPLVARVNGSVVAADDVRSSDVPLVWEGAVIAAVRLPPSTLATGVPAAPEAVGDLDQILAELATELGGSLLELSRPEKQRAVRLLEERGAFAFRRATETVAEALGVSRFTVYNYLNRGRADTR